MKKITQTIILAGTMLVVLFTACSKKGDMGPAGSKGPKGATGGTDVITDGYIKGTINGFKKDGTAFTETFTFTTSYSVEQSSVDSLSPTSYNFNITKGAIDHPFTEFKAELHFNANSLSPVTTTTASFGMAFMKSSGADAFVFGTASSGITPSISNVVYNKTTGTITGDYIVNINGSQNTTSNFANITGSFKTTIAQLYYREIKNPKQLNLN